MTQPLPHVVTTRLDPELDARLARVHDELVRRGAVGWDLSRSKLVRLAIEELVRQLEGVLRGLD